MKIEQNNEKEKEFDRKGNIIMGLVLIASSAVLTLAFGGLFYLILRPENGFGHMCQVLFFMFFAPCCVAGLIPLFTKIDNTNWIFGLGAGLYYGTIFVARILRNSGFFGSDTNRYLFAFILVALIAYIAYTKEHKKSE